MDIVDKKTRTFDAIVIGSGISGGWAAKELCEKGLKTLVLERGRNVQHIKDYTTANKTPWEFEHRGAMPLEITKENPVVSRCYAFREDAAQFFVKDKQHPYIQDKPFDWIRGYQVGGKSLTWARQTQRWSQYDYENATRDGLEAWPIGYNDIAPWYSHVEKFVGISGNKDGLDVLPDGEFLPPMELRCVDTYLQDKIKQLYKDRHLIYGRCAHLTHPTAIHAEQQRGSCQYRNLCQRGCPFGGYFSSNSSTLPWAAKTGNLTLRPMSVVHSIIFDEQLQKATGVRVVDATTKEMTEYYAAVIFVNASTINTNLILLNSTSSRFPNGLGNDNGLLGKYIIFHNYRGSVSAEYEGFQNFTSTGNRPTGMFMPNFCNVLKQDKDFLRGYAIAFYSSREIKIPTVANGVALKEQLLPQELGNWKIVAGMQGETIPKASNCVRLDTMKKDEWGMPLLHISVDYDNNDTKMLYDFFSQATDMFTKAGFVNIEKYDSKQSPGLDIHEMGGVRMGKNSKTSLLNEWNQLHECKNVFVTDGACMVTTSTQNPSLTYMAITARAANYAIEELKKKNL